MWKVRWYCAGQPPTTESLRQCSSCLGLGHSILDCPVEWCQASRLEEYVASKINHPEQSERAQTAIREMYESQLAELARGDPDWD